MPNKPDENTARWYVIRVHNMALDNVRKRLDALHVNYFLPMCHDVAWEKGRRVKKLVPAIRNFIFLRSPVTEIRRLVETEGIPLFFYYSHYSHVQNDALWVNDREMEAFMRAVTAYDRSPHIQPCGNTVLRKGVRIRITSGPLSGIEGVYLQLKRGQKKRLVLTLADLMIADIELSPEDLIEFVGS